MESMIFLRDALKIMSKVDSEGNAVPFDIAFYTYNHNNKMGCVYKKYDRAKLLIGKDFKGKKFIEADHFYREHRARKNPNHFNNKTRNIETTTGRVIKISIKYITKLNGQHVIY